MNIYIFEVYNGEEFVGTFGTTAPTIDRAMNKISEENPEVVWHNVHVNNVLRGEDGGKLSLMEV